MAKIVSPFTLTFKSIKSQFISKEKLIKSSLNVQKKSIDDKRKNSERERGINYENKLEKTLSFLGRPVKAIGKKLGFLDSLKGFIVNVLLGFITIRLLKYLPQLVSVFNTILKVGNFILDVSGKLLNGLVTFVDKGYQAADNARKLVRSIGGQKAIDALDGMNNQANSLLNSIMIAGMLFTDFGGVGTGAITSGKATDAAVDVIKDQVVKQAAQKTAQTAARAAIGPLGAAGIVLGAGLLASAVGEGAFQIKKLGKGLQGWIAGKLNESSQDKNPVTRFLKKGFFGWMNTTLGPAIWLLNGTGVLFDIVGAPFRYGIELIRGAFMKLNEDRKGLEEQNKNLGKFDARIRDGIREQYSVLAPLFNFVGMKGVSTKLQTPGSFGSLYGEKAAKDVGYYNGGIVKKFAGGGYAKSADDKNKKVEMPRTIISVPTTLNVGSTVGGPKAIMKIFPPAADNGLMDQYGHLNSSYSSLSSAGSLGPLMGLTLKSVLGDRVTDKDYENASDSLSSFLMEGMSKENPLAYNEMSSTLGTDTLKGIIKGEAIRILRNKFSEIQNQLRSQLGLKELKSEEGFSPTSEDCPCPEGSDGQFVTTGNVYERALLETISQVEGTAGPDGYRTMFGGGKFQAPPWRHPDTVVRSGKYASAAAGKYQFMPGTWAENAKKVGATDFSPANQDKVALFMIRSRHSLNPSKQLTVEQLGKLGTTWAGLTPHYGQTNRTKEQSYSIYTKKLQELGATPSSSTAKIAPGSSAANVSDCVCDPETPNASNIGGQVQAAGATAGATISGYPITSGFGARWGKLHGGIDVGAPPGKSIAINVPGEVAFAGFSGGYGNVVDIWIPTLNQMFRMAHMRDKPSVTKGQKTTAGQLLGYVGSTGSSTGPHVHFEAHNTITSAYGSKDPMPYAKYLTIGRESGGPTLSGGMRLLHKGEYVIDKDSVDLFGGIAFFSLINNVENENQRAQKSSQLIQHLSKYTGRKIDQRPDVIVEDDEDTTMMSPPVYVQSSSSMSDGGETPNWEQDILSMRG